MSLPAWNLAARLFLAGILFLLPRVSGAETPFSRLWWLNESHSPTPVNDLLHEPGGGIWLATDAGVFRFNGSAFIHLRDSGGAVTSLHSSGSGMLAGYRSGRIARVVDDSLVTIPIPGGGPAAAVTSFETWGGAIAFSTLGSGIWVLQRGAVRKFTTADGLSDDYVYRIQVLGAGRMLAATDRGLNLIGVEAGRIFTRMALDEGIVQALRPWPGRDGAVLAGLNEGRWYGLRFDAAGNCRQIAGDSLGAPVMDFAVRNGEILALTERSVVFRYGTSSTGRLGTRDSFGVQPSGDRLLADASGTLWYGNSNGLTALSWGYVRQVGSAAGFSLRSVPAITSYADLSWYGQNDTLVSLKNERVTGRERLPAQITTLAADSEGCWIGTLGLGLLRIDRSGTVEYPPGAAAFRSEHVLSLTRYRDRLWMATLSGLDEFSVDGNSLAHVRHHSKKGGLGADYVYQCVPDHRGRMWIATDGAGICCYDGRTYRRWTDGQDGFRGRTIYSIAEDRAGRIWAATLEHGISRYDGTRWTPVGRADGLQSLNVASIAALGDGQMLIVHDQGFDLWQPANEAIRHIGRRQGMAIDSSSRMLNCFAALPDGSVITPFEHGLLRFVPGPARTSLDPGIHLTEVSANGKPGSRDRQDFEPEENSPGFRFEGTNLLNSERLYYRYRLKGFMQNWILTRDESANFARLPAGDYVFEVEAAYSPAFRFPAKAQAAFSIARPFWQRWWAISIAVALLAGGALAVVRFRERNIRRIEQLQNARIQMEYEHLKSQINPHFLFNSLNILGTLIDRDPDRAREYTYALSDLYRNTLHYRDKELIPLEEEWGILMQYLLVQQTRFGNALAIESNIPPEIFRTARVVPLALQLLVENAIKHNVVSGSSPLTISIGVYGELLIISNPYRPKRNPEKGTGIGLANIRSRYGLHGRDIHYGLEDGTFTVELPLL